MGVAAAAELFGGIDAGVGIELSQPLRQGEVERLAYVLRRQQELAGEIGFLDDVLAGPQQDAAVRPADAEQHQVGQQLRQRAAGAFDADRQVFDAPLVHQAELPLIA